MPRPTPRILPSLAEVPADAWNALLDERAVPFMEHAWLLALEESGCVGGKRSSWSPRYLTLWRGTKLLAAAPSYVRQDSFGEFVWDFAWAEAAQQAGVTYYPKLTLAVPFTPATGTRMLVLPGEDRPPLEQQLLEEALALVKKEHLSSLHVLFPTQGEAERLAELGLALRLGAQYHWQNQGYGTYEDFLARFTSKQRNTLRRERRASTGQGIEISTLRGAELSEVDPGLVFRLYASTVDKHRWGHRFLTKDFFARVLQKMQHRIELVVARREGAVVAGAFNVASPTHLFGRYWGCFEDHPFLHFHVGLYHSIDECIRRGVQVFEGGAGGEHKLARGFEPALTHSVHHLAHPGLDQAVRRFLDRERIAVEEGVRGFRSSSGLRPLEENDG